MTEQHPTVASPATIALAAASRRDFDVRREALHQGTRTVSEHYDKIPAAKRADSSASRADEVVSAATKYLAFLTSATPAPPTASAGEATPDGLPVIRVGL